MSATAPLKTINFDDGTGDHPVLDSDSIHSIKVNGVSQTVSGNAVDLNIKDNLITDAQWTSILNTLA